jgi:hypothetical protein
VKKMKKKISLETILALSVIICAIVATIGPATTAVQAATVPLFGNTAIGTITDQNDANAQSISYFKSTTSGPVTDIIAYINGASAGSCIAALYAVNGNSAGALLEQSNPVSIGTTFSWIDFKLPSTYTVTLGTTYGLAIMGNVPVNIREVAGAGQRDHNAASSYANGFANPFGTIWGTDNTGAMSIYAASSSNQITNYGIGSLVYLNLPTPSNATSPPAAPGTPSHPTDIQFRCYHFNRDSSLGAYDAMLVYLWIPQRNSYNPVAFITDAVDITTFENVWNKTFIWYKIGIPGADISNVIQVGDKELQIWTSNSNGFKDDTLIVNLTKAAPINLPFNLWPAPQNSYGNLTFTLPPLTLTFRDLNAGSYTDSGANATLPSGYYRQPIADMRTPAWVEEIIPSWLGATSPLEVSGHIDWKFTEAITPPAS